MEGEEQPSSMRGEGEKEGTKRRAKRERRATTPSTPEARRTRGDGRGAMKGDGKREARPGGDHRRAEQEIEATFGFVPEFYRAMPEPVFQHAWGIQRDFELCDTTLDMKTKELIGLALAAQIKCRYCTYFHTEAAKAHGASEEELREAAAMGGMTGLFSNALTAAQIDYDRFRREVDRIIEHMTEEAGQTMLPASPT